MSLTLHIIMEKYKATNYRNPLNLEELPVSLKQVNLTNDDILSFFDLAAKVIYEHNHAKIAEKNPSLTSLDYEKFKQTEEFNRFLMESYGTIIIDLLSNYMFQAYSAFRYVERGDMESLKSIKENESSVACEKVKHVATDLLESRINENQSRAEFAKIYYASHFASKYLLERRDELLPQFLKQYP